MFSAKKWCKTSRFWQQRRVKLIVVRENAEKNCALSAVYSVFREEAELSVRLRQDASKVIAPCYSRSNKHGTTIHISQPKAASEIKILISIPLPPEPIVLDHLYRRKYFPRNLYVQSGAIQVKTNISHGLKCASAASHTKIP